MGQDMYSKYAEAPKALSTPSGAGAAGVRYGHYVRPVNAINAAPEPSA